MGGMEILSGARRFFCLLLALQSWLGFSVARSYPYSRQGDADFEASDVMG